MHKTILVKLVLKGKVTIYLVNKADTCHKYLPDARCIAVRKIGGGES